MLLPRADAAARYGPRQPRPTKLDAHKAYLLERIAATRPRWIPAVVLLCEIPGHGYAGVVTELKAFVNSMKQSRIDPVVRFETAPGDQMQGDFTVIRRGHDPLLAFVATLGYSRTSWVRFTAGEDAATMCACVREARRFSKLQLPSLLCDPRGLGEWRHNAGRGGLWRRLRLGMGWIDQ